MFDAQKYARYSVTPHGRLKADKREFAAVDSGPITDADGHSMSTMTFDRLVDRAIAKVQWSRIALVQAARDRLSDINSDTKNTQRIRSVRYWIAQREAADVALLALVAIREQLATTVGTTLRGDVRPLISFATPPSVLEQVCRSASLLNVRTVVASSSAGEDDGTACVGVYDRAVDEAFTLRARMHAMTSSIGARLHESQTLEELQGMRERADAALVDVVRMLHSRLTNIGRG